MAGSDREGFGQGWKWSGDPPTWLVLVRKPSGRVGSGRETLQEGRKWSGGPPAGPEVVVSLSG